MASTLSMKKLKLRKAKSQHYQLYILTYVCLTAKCLLFYFLTLISNFKRLNNWKQEQKFTGRLQNLLVLLQHEEESKSSSYENERSS